MRWSWLTVVLMAGSMCGCATSSSRVGPEGAGPRAGSQAAMPCGPGAEACTPGNSADSCFETLETVAYGSQVRVTSRRSGSAESCPAGRFCECVAVILGRPGGSPCRICRPVEFGRPTAGPGHWKTEVYDFGVPVTEVVVVTHEKLRDSR